MQFITSDRVASRTPPSFPSTDNSTSILGKLLRQMSSMTFIFTYETQHNICLIHDAQILRFANSIYRVCLLLLRP